MKNVIILTKGDEKEAWGGLLELCEVHGFSYNYLKRQKFPFEYKGYSFEKLLFRHKYIESNEESE